MGAVKAKLLRIETEPRPLAPYQGRGLVGERDADRIAELSAALAGVRVLYVGSAGEPAYPARDLVPMLLGLGVEAERAVASGERAFHHIARAVDDAARGAEWGLDEARWRTFREAWEVAAVSFDPRPYDAVIVSGAAAAPLIEGARDRGRGWIWRTAGDLTAAGEVAWSALGRLLARYPTLCFSLPEFVPAGVGGSGLRVIPGAIDPLGPVDVAAAPGWLSRMLAPLGIDLRRPLVCFAGRLDGWPDPLAAVDCWQLSRQEVPGVQLAIAGRLDPGEPERAGVLAEIEAFAGTEPDLHVIAAPADAGRAAAALRASRCLIHVGLGDGFYPGPLEALWAGTPVVGFGRGLAAQIDDGADGFLADTNEAIAGGVADLCADAGLAAAMGRRGRERVGGQFLLPRLLADELGLLAATVGRAEVPPHRAAAAGGRR